MKSLKPGHLIAKILLFRTHHLWNSTTELILRYILQILATSLFFYFADLCKVWGRLDNIYRVIHKFSYTWNELFLVSWFTVTFFCENAKWKKVSYPHYLEIVIKLSKNGLSYSLKRDPKSISKITFLPIRVLSPIDTELYFFQKTVLSFQN